MFQSDSEHVERVFDRFADRYDRSIGCFERFAARGAREWAVSSADGRVLELAVGTGLNLPLYGPAVRHVTGVDISGRMLGLARERAARERIEQVELQQGDVQSLDLPDQSVDTVVSTFTFCTIPDPAAASREAYRALRPGGRLVLAEHGPSSYAPVRFAMRALDPLSRRFAADHLMRNPAPYLEEAGFVVDEVHRGGRAGVVFGVLAHRPAVPSEAHREPGPVGRPEVAPVDEGAPHAVRPQL